MYPIGDKKIFQWNNADFTEWFSKLLNKDIKEESLQFVLTFRPDFITQIAADEPCFVPCFDYALSRNGNVVNDLSDAQIKVVIQGMNTESTLMNIRVLLKQRPSLMYGERLKKFLDDNQKDLFTGDAPEYLAKLSLEDLYRLKSVVPATYCVAIDKAYETKLENLFPQADPLAIGTVALLDAKQILNQSYRLSKEDKQQINQDVLQEILAEVNERKDEIVQNIKNIGSVQVDKKGKTTNKKGIQKTIKGKRTPYSFIITPEGKLIITPKSKKADMSDNKKMEHRKFKGSYKKVELAYQIDLTAYMPIVEPVAVVWPNIINYEDSASNIPLATALAQIESDYYNADVSEAIYGNVREPKKNTGIVQEDTLGKYFVVSRQPLDLLVTLGQQKDNLSTEALCKSIFSDIIANQAAGVPVLDSKIENMTYFSSDSPARLFDVTLITERADDGQLTVLDNPMTPGFSMPLTVKESGISEDFIFDEGKGYTQTDMRYSLAAYSSIISQNSQALVNYSTYAALMMLIDLANVKHLFVTDDILQNEDFLKMVKDDILKMTMFAGRDVKRIRNKQTNTTDQCDFRFDHMPSLAEYLSTTKFKDQCIAEYFGIKFKNPASLQTDMLAYNLRLNTLNASTIGDRKLLKDVQIISLADMIKKLESKGSGVRKAVKVEILKKLNAVLESDQPQRRISNVDLTNLLDKLKQTSKQKDDSKGPKSLTKLINGRVALLRKQNMIVPDDVKPKNDSFIYSPMHKRSSK